MDFEWPGYDIIGDSSRFEVVLQNKFSVFFGSPIGVVILWSPFHHEVGIGMRCA